jgi:hypothetical protein
MSKYDERDQCGVGIFSTGENDAFAPECTWHDEMYVKRKKGDVTFDRITVDKIFLFNMLHKADSNILLKTKAYTYYILARIFGRNLWRSGHYEKNKN